MLPRIAIETTPGTLSIKSTPARLSCRPGQYEMNYSNNAPAALEMKTSPPRIQIDQTDAFASAGLKPMHRQTMDFYAQSLQKGLRTIGRIAGDGLEFLRIEKGGDPIVSQARAKGMKDVRLTVRAMPSSPPEISVLLGHVDVSVGGGLEADWQWVEGESEYTPYSISVEWKPSTIEITVVPGTEMSFPVSRGVGVNVDEAI